MDRYRAKNRNSLLEIIIGIIILAVAFLVVYQAGYHQGEFNALRKYADQKSCQTIPLQVVPKDETQEINYIQIHQPCKLFIKLTER